ncbi:DNRLRE domain-containing protein [Streptomyces sp. S.PB5]|uniref:DNRLRE domain-containing protein n=1 Tax=Streptomyces sp. S.PB5 TaxID=3020844 RepID=UPI0025B1972B|nr:DNRLRE domain-containing protein [Streptomyces sp. S.PB5]MDN3023482.1 DNRLRE domain-containing protein [Streptomyces sp. S.PB5]
MLGTQPALISTAASQALADVMTGAGTSVASATERGPAQAADEASARLMARLQDRRIEILSERTEDSTTWANPDGSLTTEAFSGPVRVQDADDDWHDIDTTLADTGAAVTPKATAAEVALSDGGTGTLASVQQGKHVFAMGWSKSLPAPTLKGDTATYALGGGADLTVQALPQGFEQSVVLSERPEGEVSYRIPLDLKGLELSKADNGHLLLKSAAGDVVAEASAPAMWGSDKDKASGDPAHVAEVDTAIEKDADGSTVLVLKPDADFLADPDVTYPVTVDPVSTLAASTDTWVATNYPDSQRGSTELKAGTYDTGTTVARSYVKFDVTKLKGKHIVDTNLALYSYYSSTCATTGAGVQVRRITADWDPDTVAWGAQPATTTTDAKTNTAALGYSSSCPAGYMNFDVDGITQAWADGSANYGLQVRGADETDSLTWRRFRSANYASGDAATEPHLTVTYNSYGTTSVLAVSPSTVNAYNGSRYVTSLTPLLSAKVTDADGGTVKAQFEVTPNPSFNDAGTYSYTGTSAGVASGSTAKLSVPSGSAFPAGSHLRVRVRAYDGTDYGTWSGYTNFTLNTAKPAAPGVTCTPYAKDVWTEKAAAGANCVLDTSSSDGQGYYWGLDDPNASQRIDDTTNGSGGDPLTVTIKPAEGWHTLYAKTVDSGGNVSTDATAYAFGVGGAALLTPARGDRPNSTVALTSRGGNGSTGVTYQYRRGETDTWQDVPVGDVTKSADGSALASWPLSMSDTTPAGLTWNITKTLTEDGPVDVRAKFTGSATVYSPANTVTVDRWGGADLAEDIAPGGVNAVTGDQTFGETDATAFDLNATRTASSRRPDLGKEQDGLAPIYGLQWNLGLGIDRTSTTWVYLRKTSATSVAAVRADGSAVGFNATAGGWSPEPGSQDLTLTGSLTTSFTLKHTNGSVTKFAKVDPAVTSWQITSTSMPTDNSTTTVVWDKTTSGGKTLARPKYLIAPTTAVSAATCQATPSTKGCRVLEYVYADTTTATTSAFGDVTGQVKQIKLWATAPGAANATATAVASYAYDSEGRLREAWDPRISPALKTAYTYTSAGRIATLTPPGELPWTYSYGQVGSAAPSGPGMLLSVSRPTLKAGSATETDGTAVTKVVYNVALSGSHAPYDLSATGVATWGQNQRPVRGTAVFPADASAKAPASNDGADAASSDFTRATVTYFSVSGRAVNTAEPGGHISTTEYDDNGAVVRELTAANRELALSTSGNGLDQLTVLGIDGLSTADRAQQLSTVSTYSADGSLIDEYGPLHLVVLQSVLKAGTGGTDLAAGSQVPARQHTANSYDEGRPTDGTATVSKQLTTTVTSGYIDGYPSGADSRTTKTAYDWAKGLPTKEIEDPSGKNVLRTTGYDSQGRITSESEPLSSGTDAGTTAHRYWTASGSGSCQGRPEWADLECTAGPADASAGNTQTTEYDRWGQPAKSIVTGGTETRTTTASSDDAGRVVQRVTSGNGDQAVPSVTTTYDSATGQVATMASSSGTISYGYDALGRLIRYDDGEGNVTTTQYDSLDRPVKVSDSAPSTTDYTYDAAKEPRGLVTGLNDSVAGTISAAYDGDGALSTEKIPGGITLAVDRDPAGNDLSRTYTTSTGVVAFADNADVNVHGQDATRSQTKGSSVSADYTYDALGRSATMHTGNWFSCTDESYDFDSNSRLKKITKQSGSCLGTRTTTETTRSYDSAGRVTDTGYSYDALGRPTAQPDGIAFTYYADSSVRRQTRGSSRETAVYDAASRPVSVVTETLAGGTWSTTGTAKNHYSGPGKQTAWQEGTSVVRHVNDALDEPVAMTGASGNIVLQLIDLSGETAVQLPLDESQAPVVDSGDDPAVSPYGAIGFQQMGSFAFDIFGVTIHVPVGCEIGHRIHGSGRKITDQAAWVGCDEFYGNFTRGFCNWRLEFHYADTNGKTYKILKGTTHTTCSRGPWRQIKTDRTLPHYGKACAQFVVTGKRRGVQCHYITR